MKLLISTALISTAMIATSAMAQQPLQASTPLNTVELNTIFESSQINNLQATELSNQEMKDTQGAVLPFVAGVLVGGALGAWSNHGITYYQTGNFASTESTLFATGAGAIGGGYSNLMLRGAGISTSIFAPSAWRGVNMLPNTMIRANGAAIGFSQSGIYNQIPNTSINNIKITPYQPTNQPFRPR